MKKNEHKDPFIFCMTSYLLVLVVLGIFCWIDHARGMKRYKVVRVEHVEKHRPTLAEKAGIDVDLPPGY